MASGEQKYFLSKADRDFIQGRLGAVGNRARRPGSSNSPADPTTAPEVYPALSPAGGIPAAFTSSSKTVPGDAVCVLLEAVPRTEPGTGTGSEVGTGNAQDLELVETEFTESVYNLTDSAVPPDTPFLAVRDKWGTYWVSGGGAGGSSVDLLLVTGGRIDLTPGTGTGTGTGTGDVDDTGPFVYPARVVSGFEDEAYVLGDDEVYFRRADGGPPPKTDGTGFYFGRTYGVHPLAPDTVLYHGESQGGTGGGFPAVVTASSLTDGVVTYEIAEAQTDATTKLPIQKPGGRTGVAYRGASSEVEPPAIPVGQGVWATESETVEGAYEITPHGGQFEIIEEVPWETIGFTYPNPGNCDEGVVATMTTYRTRRLSGRELCGGFSPAGEGET